MADPVSDFQQAIQRIRDGDEAAAWELIERYGPQIQRVIRRRLDRRLRSKFDSADFVQMVWASFFRDPDKITGFDDPTQLSNFLVSLARNKVVDEYRRRIQTQKYGVNKECSLHEKEWQSKTLEADQATPSQIAIARERWAALMDTKSDRDREVVRLRMQGATFNEIAEKVGIHERTARKIIGDLLAAHLV